VGKLLREEARHVFPLKADRNNLYTYIERQIAEYWNAHVPPSLNKVPQFEHALYAIFALAAAFPAGQYTSALGYPELAH
jgi:hypothetical protein